MQDRNVGELIDAYRRGLRNENRQLEGDLRRALDNGDWVVSFSYDNWGETVCDQRDPLDPATCISQHTVTAW